MFNIDELLYFFDDDNVKKIILSSYLISQRQNSKLSDIVFQQLLFLKRFHPELCIEIDYEKNKPSNYNPQTNRIELNGIFDETTFLHEVIHMFSYQYSQFVIPQEFYNFRNRFLSAPENESIIISFLNLCESLKEKNLKKSSSIEIQNNINEDLDNTNIENDCDYFIICKIEDIIDSIYSGKSHTQGLIYIKDNNSYPKKSSKSAGHGCEYFEKTGYEFEEIIANYQAIKMIAPNNQLFLLLKQILGDDFVSFLDERCQLIIGQKPQIVENNNNVNKI